MKKIVTLVEDIKDGNGNVVASMLTALRGDGSTPVIQTSSSNQGSIIGYHDDGSIILDESTDALITNAERRFRAEAIKEQKKLCIKNGVDPDLVNILNAEKKVNTDE